MKLKNLSIAVSLLDYDPSSDIRRLPMMMDGHHGFGEAQACYYCTALTDPQERDLGLTVTEGCRFDLNSTALTSMTTNLPHMLGIPISQADLQVMDRGAINLASLPDYHSPGKTQDVNCGNDLKRVI